MSERVANFLALVGHHGQILSINPTTIFIF